MYSENPKALLCLGIEDYFYGGRDEGIRNLRFVAEKGMKATNYVCEILSLLAGGDVVKEEGLRFLEGVRKVDDVRGCRNMVKFVMDNNMWVNDDRGTELEKKKKNVVVVPRCGCVGRLSENPKALLCLGIEDYFYGGRDEWIRNLRFVAEKGMKAAKYVCEILSLLASGDVEKEEGLRFLEGVRKADDVRECMNMVKFVMDNNMWVNGDKETELEKKNKNEVVVPR
ncbi:hypothetical protein LINPERHAP2_LOCUS6535 [Linum perenne]